jgi:hypothetical protein
MPHELVYVSLSATDSVISQRWGQGGQKTPVMKRYWTPQISCCEKLTPEPIYTPHKPKALFQSIAPVLEFVFSENLL